MLRVLSCLLAATLATGCLSGSHAYLRLSTDFGMPREWADAGTYPELADAWLRHETLGLEGAIAAVLEDPVVGAARLAREAARSGTPGRPGGQAQEAWDALYKGGDRIPVHVRWHFNKYFHRETAIDPGSGWLFTLSDDAGNRFAPVEIGPVETVPDQVDWIGEFRIWFPRRSVDGRLLITGRTRSLTLSVAGSHGEATLVWRFRPLLGGREGT